MKTMKKLLSCLLLSAAATSALATPAQAATFYASTGNKEIGKIDDKTGYYTQLASTPDGFTDIALDPEGKLWGVNFDELYENTGGGTYSKVGDLGAEGMNALGFTDDGVLYGASMSGGFYSIDTSSGAALLRYSISGFSSSGDIVFDAARDLFWATSSGDSLWSITRDGVGTKVGDIGYSRVYGLAFGDDGTLFGYTTSGDQLALNLETGAGTFVRKVSGLSGDLLGAASEPDATKRVSIPEPSALAGLAVIALMLCRKGVAQLRDDKGC